MRADKKTNMPTLEFARHDPAHCLSGLFRSYMQNERNVLKLDCRYHFGKKEWLWFRGPEPLGVDDLRILQSVVAIATAERRLLPAEPTHEVGRALQGLLAPRKDPDAQRMFTAWCEEHGSSSEKDVGPSAETAETCFVRSTASRLLSEAGYKDGGSARTRLLACLRRMSSVTLIIRRGRYEASAPAPLLSYKIDHETGELVIALHVRLAGAIIGGNGYTRIDMREVRTLRTDQARLLHQRLCASVDLGRRQRFMLTTLCSYIWPVVSTNKRTLRYRRQKMQAALQEIVATGGWTVEPATTPGQVVIGRRRILNAKPATKPPASSFPATNWLDSRRHRPEITPSRVL